VKIHIFRRLHFSQARTNISRRIDYLQVLVVAVEVNAYCLPVTLFVHCVVHKTTLVSESPSEFITGCLGLSINHCVWTSHCSSWVHFIV